MEKELIKFENSEIEVTKVDNIIYLNVVGEYTNMMAFKMTNYLENWMETIPKNPVRIWNAYDIPPELFKLTSDCVRALARWSAQMKLKRPDLMAYLIGPSDISFGMGRMHRAVSNIDENGISVIRSFDDLPDEIKVKLRE